MLYQVTVKTNSTCPLKEQVRDLVQSGNTLFHTVIGKGPIMGMIPVYVDEIKPENMYGFITNVSDGSEDSEPLSQDAILELAALRPVVTLESVYRNVFSGSLCIEDCQEAGISGEESPELHKLAQEKIEAGILTSEEWHDRFQVMADNCVPESLKIQVVRGYRQYHKGVHRPSCVYVDPFLDKIGVGEEGIISEGLRNAVNRMPTICEGEKSVGKNVFMETIAWLLGMPLYMIAFSRNMNPSSVYGEKSTDNSASERLRDMHMEAKAKVMLEAGIVKPEDQEKAIDSAADYELQKARAASVSIVVDASELFDWMTDGGVMVFNEMNMAEPNFFSSFTNPLTDGTGFLFIPGRGEVKMNDDCVLFGTQNADYEGVMQQNEATMSRFNSLYFKQPESVKNQFMAAVNSALDKAGCSYKLDDAYYTQAEKFYAQCMKSVRKGIVSNAVLNIRGFVRALTTVAKSEGFCSLKRWLQISVINTCPSDEREALGAVLESIVTL